jgi:LysR family transcriptional regulator (chromosome initiation inhibitor)
MFQIDQLHTLLAVVDEGTFEAAARRLRLTASAVSQRVKAMEQSAGRVLLQRSNPVEPTDAGAVVLRYARQMAVLASDTARELGDSEHMSGDWISLPVAVNADSLATWFLTALAAVPRSLGVVFDVLREDQEHTTSLLRSGSVMAAVTATAEAVQGCTSVPLGVMRYRAVCSPGFASEWLANESGGAGMNVERLDAAPMVDFDRKDDIQHTFIRERLGRDPLSPRHYVPTSADFARAVVLGFGWALLPEQQCLAEIASGALREISPGDGVDIPLYWQRWNLQSSLLDAVSSAVVATAAHNLRPPHRAGRLRTGNPGTQPSSF